MNYKSGYGGDSIKEQDTVISLSDPTYRHIMEVYFRKLGPKTTKKKNKSKLTEAEAAEEVFNMFKNKGGRLLKRSNWRDSNSPVLAIDEAEARQSEYLLIMNYYFILSN